MTRSTFDPFAPDKTKLTDGKDSGEGVVKYEKPADPPPPDPDEEPEEVIEEAWLIINAEGKGGWMHEHYDAIAPGADQLSTPHGKFLKAEQVKLPFLGNRTLRITIFKPEEK